MISVINKYVYIYTYVCISKFKNTCFTTDLYRYYIDAKMSTLTGVDMSILSWLFFFVPIKYFIVYLIFKNINHKNISNFLNLLIKIKTV